MCKKQIGLRFSGHDLTGFHRSIAATCEVRHELNHERQAHQVVRTFGSTHPHGLPYQPRPFPPGKWLLTNVAEMGYHTEYWPVWIGTTATQRLPVWELDVDGHYKAETGRMFDALGYGVHHARFRPGEQLVPSRTTLGCINILEPSEAQWLADEIREAWQYHVDVYIVVPPWDQWQPMS